MPRTRPPYPPEFRREAVELVRISSKSQRQIAEDLGISDVTLRNWVKQAERDEGKRPDGLSSDEREELARLRRRLIKAGTLDGTIGATRIHGAERSLVRIIDSSREIARGTEFDAGGSRSFVLHVQYTITHGQRDVRGTGRWTGGTGAYKHARGTFTVSGGGPPGGLLPVRETGWISYS